MRISTSVIYEQGLTAMQQQTERMLHTQQQVASGRRMLSPADDPVGAARALDISQAQAVNQRYIGNIDAAADALALQESTLGSVQRLLQDVRDSAVQAGNPVLAPSDLATIAANLRGRFQELLGLANSTDGQGRYIFSGYQGTIQPFSQTSPAGVLHNGDQGQRELQVSASRLITVSESGDRVFQRILSGNGNFATAPAASNQGQAVIDAGQVLDVQKWQQSGNSQDLTIRFAVNAGVTSYDIIDNQSGNSLLTGLPPGASPYPGSYSGDGTIYLGQTSAPAFDFGAQIGISGPPADGDSFSIQASSPQDMFSTIGELANLLQSGADGAALSNGLSASLSNIDRALEHVLTLRSGAGVKMAELGALKNTSQDRDLQHSQSLSRLQDLDYAQALSDLSRRQVQLEAAQKSFAKISGLSLFDFI